MHSENDTNPWKAHRLSAFFKCQSFHNYQRQILGLLALKILQTEKRTKGRYVKGDKILQKAIKDCGHQWRGFSFGELNRELENINDSQFENKINTGIGSIQG